VQTGSFARIDRACCMFADSYRDAAANVNANCDKSGTNCYSNHDRDAAANVNANCDKSGTNCYSNHDRDPARHGDADCGANARGERCADGVRAGW